MIQCTPIGAVGAEVDGIDRNMISDEDLENLKALFAENGLLFFRDQELSPEAHLDFAKKWGPINVNRFFTPVEGYPSIAEVRKEPHQQFKIGGNWHTDHSYDLPGTFLESLPRSRTIWQIFLATRTKRYKMQSTPLLLNIHSLDERLCMSTQVSPLGLLVGRRRSLIPFWPFFTSTFLVPSTHIDSSGQKEL